MKRYLGAATAALLLAFTWTTPALALEVPEGEEFAAGIYVEEMSLAGMTHEEATEALKQHVEELKQTSVTVTFGGKTEEDGTVTTEKTLETTLGDLGLTWSNTDILDGVDKVGKVGSLLNRYKQLKDLNESNLVFELEYEIDEKVVADYIKKEAVQFNAEMVDATITKTEEGFDVTPSVVGMVVDLEATAEKLAAEALAWEKKEPLTVAAVVEETQPKYSYEALSSIKYAMGSQFTWYSGAADRNTNVKLGTSMINGTVILPGETWSANATMEPYTPERGWKKGGSFKPDGTVEYTYGGGICQISSTLYNAALKAEVGIAQRNNHSMIVTYLPYALDAAIADDVKDLKLRNDYDFPIYIEGTTKGGKLTFTVWGAQEGRDVRLSSVTTFFQEQTVTYVDDPTQPIGFEETISSGHPGVKATSYKRVYDKDGKLIEETILSKDSYRMSPDIVRRGTMEVPTDAPTEAPGEGTIPTPEAPLPEAPLPEPETPAPSVE